ncbi:MAG: efflux RND transporter permease subunit [Candidatus Obscuribacterales bacterium]|nr:efflux RND transporter permease subunit [Candidatus Obscuribacterales bacterium]
MNVSEIFIRRPVMTTLVMAAILIFGALGYKSLAVNSLPNVDFPTINVSASMPGASPETMASSVATPLEREFSTIAGLDSMNSTSALGSCQVTLQFNLSRNIDSAAQDVQAAIAAAGRQLPAGMPTPPTFKKVNPADMPILFLAVSSPTLPIWTVDEYAETLIAQRLSMISGVSQVQVMAPQKYAVRVQVDPSAMATKGVGLDEIAQAIKSSNVNLPVGTLYGEYHAFNLQPNGQLLNAAAYQPLIVAYKNGAPVRVRDVGHAIDSVENDKVASWYNNTRAIVLGIQRQPGSNTIQVIDEINKVMPTLRAQIPASVSVDTLYDRSLTIRESVNDVQLTLGLTVGLVIMVIFVFLRNVSATVIPSLALPFSIIGTFAAMYLLGFSINNLTLMALTLSVGFVVDDAIVVLENVVRHQELGEQPKTAALLGSSEITFTILSMTLSLVAVFIPILLMGGVVGRLFNEFAMTITIAILISGFVSLSLTPMLCSRFLKVAEERKPNVLFEFSERGFDAMLRFYRYSLQKVLQHQKLTLLAFLGMTVLTAYLFTAVPKGFIPTEDIDQILGMTEAAQGTSYKDMVRHQMQLMEICLRNPNVACAMTSVGAGGPNASGNTGRIFMRLKPRAKRKESANEIMEELRPQFAKVPGIRMFLQVPPTIRIGGQLTKSLYQVALQSADTESMYKVATQLETKLKAMPNLQDVTSDLQMKNPQVNVDIDRDKTAALGLTMEQIEDALASAYGNRMISTIYAPSNQYRVILELEPKYQMDPGALNLLYVRSSQGDLIPLSTVAKLEPTAGPLLINHVGQLPSVTVSFNLKKGVALGDAVKEVEKVTKSVLPDSVSYKFQGTAEVFQSSLQNMVMLLLVAIVVIYLVLGILYESFIQPLTILAGLPSAALGALATLMVFHVDLDIYGFLGLIMLIGIVKKNAIMVVDFALELQRNENMPYAKAAYEACIVRFRPIMMTTFAAIMGSVPLALGLGAGGESRQPLGLTVFGGLMVSQLVTLYITPVFYILFESLSEKIKARKAAEASSPPSRMKTGI